MNIYIYGSRSFKKDVHDELDHSNIKFKIDDSSSITDVDTLEDLRHLIANKKDDIFLIDDAKIIKKEDLNNKLKSRFKFLIPKDGIEEEYLFEHGIGDISFDSIDELSNHITNKIESQNPEESDELENRDEIHDSISDIVNEAYSEDDESIHLDAELNALLVSKDEENNQTNDIINNSQQNIQEVQTQSADDFDFETQTSDIEAEPSSKADDMLDELMHLEIDNNDFETPQNNDAMMQELEELSISNDDFETQESKKKSTLSSANLDLEEQLSGITITNEDFGQSLSVKKEETNDTQIGNIQGDYEMAGDFSSLDDINESDIIAALNGEEVAISDTQVLTSTKQSESVSVSLDNTDDISELLSKLLKNKTLEITVKIKD